MISAHNLIPGILNTLVAIGSMAIVGLMVHAGRLRWASVKLEATLRRGTTALTTAGMVIIGLAISFVFWHNLPQTNPLGSLIPSSGSPFLIFLGIQFASLWLGVQVGYQTARRLHPDSECLEEREETHPDAMRYRRSFYRKPTALS